jgi:hypothetical protein
VEGQGLSLVGGHPRARLVHLRGDVGNSKPISVTRVYKHANVEAAKKAETKRYHSTKAKLGANKVRGAGHTKAFPKKK